MSSKVWISSGNSDVDDGYWQYPGDVDGDAVEVEVVDLGNAANKSIRKLYQQPTNLSELNFLEV